MRVDGERLRVWVEASCAAQGVPVFVADAVVIADALALVKGRDAAGGRPEGGTRSARPSHPPGGNDPLGSEYLLHPGDSGKDGRVVKHGPYDGDLAVKVEGLPPVA